MRTVYLYYSAPSPAVWELSASQSVHWATVHALESCSFLFCFAIFPIFLFCLFFFSFLFMMLLLCTMTQRKVLSWMRKHTKHKHTHTHSMRTHTHTHAHTHTTHKAFYQHSHVGIVFHHFLLGCAGDGVVVHEGGLAAACILQTPVAVLQCLHQLITFLCHQPSQN